jgi:hypothetical protein
MPKQVGPYLSEGGAYGHMAHPFDNHDLTFGDLKEIVRRSLSGNLDIEKKMTEKTDGQNLMISWKNSKLIAARNKGHIKNFGQNAMDLKAVEAKFAGRGELSKAFNGAMEDLENAIKRLTDAQKGKIFAEGKKFMNLEIIFPGTTNVIPYQGSLIIFHGTLEYDESGNPIGEDGESARVLAGMIKQVNQHVQSNFKIEAPPVVKLPKVKNFASEQSKFFREIDTLRSRFGLKDTDLVVQYHVEWWKQYIDKNLGGYKIPENIKAGLVKRWAYNDKGAYSLNDAKREIQDEKFLNWVIKTDKEDSVSIFKKNIKPFEILFLKLGAQVLQNVEDLVAANPDESVQNLKKELHKVIADIKASNNLDVLSKLETQMNRLNAIGGMDAIVPIEGVVFTYKGKVYKLTGTFAPVNQILGMLKYAR